MNYGTVFNLSLCVSNFRVLLVNTNVSVAKKLNSRGGAAFLVND